MNKDLFVIFLHKHNKNNIIIIIKFFVLKNEPVPVQDSK
jgi:hypothetical protein